MADFDKKYNILDIKTPPATLLSAHYKQLINLQLQISGSFAYYTLRERSPVIITQVLDNLSRDKDQIAINYGEEARDELEDILGKISKLICEVQTDKMLNEFTRQTPDKELWNKFLRDINPEDRTFCKICWLYAECYMYRRLRSFFEDSRLLRDYDYFRKQKENALTCCTEALKTVAADIVKAISSETSGDFVKRLLKLNLWGNRCDLSMSVGEEIKQNGDSFSVIDSLNKYILIDEADKVAKCVSSIKTNKIDPDKRIIDFVIDNSGYELFTDLLIADFLLEKEYATKIRFHVKNIPWYISDVTPYDFEWTLQYLSDHNLNILSHLGNKWIEYQKCGKFELLGCEYFWTGPYEFYRMKEIDPNLYEKLSEAHLVIFKGDLNYRKLIGEFNWKFTESFKTCLRGFQPTNICALRTVKTDIICGLKEGLAEALSERDSKWMTTGEYGVIQFASKEEQ